jgi:hypothetical protein
MIVIDKGRIGNARGQRGDRFELAEEHFLLLFSRRVWPIHLAIMSALQTFMLVVDHDKEEAKR